MQIGTATSGNAAMDQVARSIQAMNQLNQTIVDETQELGNKMLRVSTEAKVASENPAAEQVIDFLA
jgi:hypothetical protein